jgi:hypothetical protein
MRNLARWILLGIGGLGGAGLFLGAAGCKPAATAPRPERAGWFLDAERYRSSVHGRVECTGCHSEADLLVQPAAESDTPPLPHGKAIPKAWRPSFDGCKSCHPYEYDQFQGGSHGAALAELAPGFPDCATCHSAHYGQPRRGRGPAAAEQLQRCGSCHPAQAAALTRDRHPAPGHRPEDGFACGTCHDVHAAQKLGHSPKGQPVCEGCHAHDQKGKRHAAN